MNTKLVISINSLADFAAGRKLFDGENFAVGQMAELVGVGILQGGMDSGKSSVTLAVKLSDGSMAYAQTSAKLFHMADGAVLGAQARFGESDGH